MKNRRAISFFLGWSAIFALALVAAHLMKGSGGNQPASTLSALDVRRITSIGISRSNPAGVPERISLELRNGRWRIEEPVSAEADGDVIRKVVDGIVFAEAVDRLTGADMAALGRSFRDFGLAAPRCTVTLSAGDSVETFVFGRVAPAGGEVYVRRGGENDVFTVPVRVMEGLLRPLSGFRRRRLFTFAPYDVTGIGFKEAGGQFTRLSKSGTSWRLADPVDAPADRQVAEGLVASICEARIIDYPADADVGTGTGLGEGEGLSVLLRDSSGSVEKVVLGMGSGTNSIWALTSEGAVVRVGAGLLDLCRRKRKELEDTRIFPVDAASVLSFTVSEGFPAYVASRKDPSASWRLVSPVEAVADSPAVDALLARALALRGSDLLHEGSEGAVSVSVVTATTNFPVRFVSGAALIGGMGLSDMHDKLMIKCARGEVKRISVRTAAGVEWNAAGSEDMLGLLESGIVADRIEMVALKSEDFSRFGFDRPSYTVSFELSDAASPLRRMLIGNSVKGGGRYAAIGGADAAFVLSAETVSAVVKPVSEHMEVSK